MSLMVSCNSEPMTGDEMAVSFATVDEVSFCEIAEGLCDSVIS